jgi:transcriptional regulator of heat shock response
MNSLLIGPILMNPEALDSIEALRRELQQANSALLKQFDQLVSYEAMARQVVETINELLRLNRQHDQAAIIRLLDEYLASRPQLCALIDQLCLHPAMHRVH